MKTNLHLCLDIQLSGVKEAYLRAKSDYEQALFQFISQNIYDIHTFDQEWTQAKEDLVDEFYEEPFLGKIAIFGQMINNAFDYGIENPPLQ